MVKKKETVYWLCINGIIFCLDDSMFSVAVAVISNYHYYYDRCHAGAKHQSLPVLAQMDAYIKILSTFSSWSSEI